MARDIMSEGLGKFLSVSMKLKVLHWVLINHFHT